MIVLGVIIICAIGSAVIQQLFVPDLHFFFIFMYVLAINFLIVIIDYLVKVEKHLAFVKFFLNKVTLAERIELPIRNEEDDEPSSH